MNFMGGGEGLKVNFIKKKGFERNIKLDFTGKKEKINFFKRLNVSMDISHPMDSDHT